MELFKMVIKTHNRSKAEKHKGISFLQIDQLIKQFSDQNKLNQVSYQQLKFQLIDKNSLTSQEYKEIFLDDAKRKRTSQYCSMIRMEPQNKNNFNNPNFLSSKLTQSLITPTMIPLNSQGPGMSSMNSHGSGMLPMNSLGSTTTNSMNKMNDELTLQMENTFEKKKNEQLKAQNQFLFKGLQQLKEVTAKNKSEFDEIREVVIKLQRQVQQKQKVDKQQSNIIKKLQKQCDDLKKQLGDRGQVIKKLQEKVTKLEKMPDRMPDRRVSGGRYLPIDDQSQQSRTVVSRILPGNVINQIAKPAAEALSAPPSNAMKKPKPASSVVAVMQQKEQSQPDEQQLQEMYLSRLTFDQQPRGCPKKYLPNLANMLTAEGFEKKKLNLIYRRNVHNQQVRGSPQDIFGKQSLVVVICTRMNQIIGGYVSIQISKNEKDYIRDNNSFIFSLSKNEKFAIKKNCEGEALFITSQYLICFSNDIMISLQPCKEKSQSDWPCAYEGSTGVDKRSSKWLTGEEGQFMAKQVEIYEVKEEAMEMEL